MQIAVALKIRKFYIQIFQNETNSNWKMVIMSINFVLFIKLKYLNFNRFNQGLQSKKLKLLALKNKVLKII